MSRGRRPRSAVGLVVAGFVAALAFAPRPAPAQTAVADTGTDLLQPSFTGNPNNPPRFRRPGRTTAASDQAPPTTSFSAPLNSNPPVYGSPTGFGAGDTGFDSSNGRRRRVRAPGTGASIAPPPAPQPPPTETFTPVAMPPPEVPSVPPRLPPPLRPTIYPLQAANRPGAALPPPAEELPISNPPPEVHPLSAANRHGAVLPVPPSLDVTSPASGPPVGTPLPGTLPLGTPSRPLPIAGVDPYEAIGIKAGSFLLLPSLDYTAGYDNNPQHVPGGVGSSTMVVSPELHVRSDWVRHAFTADITGSYFWYGNDNAFSPSLNRPYFNSKLDGRVDVTRDTQILLENRVIVATDNPGSPNIQAGLAKLPVGTTVGGTAGVEHEFSRLDVSLKGTFDRSMYGNSMLTDGENVSFQFRNYDQYAGILRVGYEIDPGFKPFAEVTQDARVYDLKADPFGEDRDSTGTAGKLGAQIDLFGSLTGEIALGYLQRWYVDPTLPNIGGVTLDGALIWRPTGLTTAKFTASSAVNESTVQGVSAGFSRDFDLEVDHALRRWLIAIAKFGYGHDQYVGEGRIDNRYFTSFGLTYKMNPSVQLRSEVRYDWLTSTATGVAYNATSFIVGMRLQR